MEEQLLQMLIGMIGGPAVLIAAGIGALIVLAEVIVIMTPSTADDEAWAKIKAFPIVGGLIQAFAKLAPIQKKPKDQL